MGERKKKRLSRTSFLIQNNFSLVLLGGRICKSGKKIAASSSYNQTLLIFQNLQAMTTQQIAKRLVELCREGKYDTAHKELYSDSAISIEPEASQGFEKETKGLKAIMEKGNKFDSMVEKMHGTSVTEPLVSDHSIAFGLNMDVTMKGRGRTKMEELCVYQVKDGKIVSEQFFM
jgi:hypothetical protein